MSAKEQVKSILEQLPDNCTLDDIQHRLYIIQTIQRRIAEADTTTGIPHEEVKARLAQWRQK